MKLLKKIGLALLVILIVIQVIRPEKNDSNNKTNSIAAAYPIPDDVNTILVKACNDCHTNNTTYPWYSNIQPVAWWLQKHVNDGKKHLNFDEFTSYRLRKQYHKLEEVIEQVKGHEMPLDSYTWIHKDAKLTDAEAASLTGWAQAVMDSMKARYPIDSLVKPKGAK
jgi:hypothetical protein